ncbi:MAG: trypsin-like peptidase domain-containing protein [Lachnospiraceae bacterium]|nr:trypsin-like peptidase domain-containing protein [Lachnospiraceae bacterium]
MKKKGIAILLGIVVVGAGVGTATQLYSYADDVKLQIAGAESESETEQAADAAASNTASADAQVGTANLVSTDSMDTDYTGVSEIAQNTMPTVVAITNKSVQEVQGFYRGQTYQYESESAGSGIIVGENDTELLICTNNHVVEGSSELTVSFIDESSYEAQVKGTDAANDLAVVAVKLEDISADTLKQIKNAQMGSSDDLKVGEQVVAIGNALGYGQSVTTGIVSALDRTIDIQDSMEAVSYENLIQTDAAINPGNSGGALMNMSGEVIGINSAKASSNGVEGMGYAIPISKAQPILEKLMSKETRSKVDDADTAYMGISGQGVTSEVTQLYSVPAGVYVTEVAEGGPAEEAGLQQGDIITAFDDNSVTSMDELKNLMQYYKGGETVNMTVQTAANGAYTEKTVSITLGLKSDYAM